MNRKTFILVGLFLIALGPISFAFQTFSLLGETPYPVGTYAHIDLFRYVAIPLVFGLLIWKRLVNIGKSRRFAACFIVGFLVAIYMSIFFLTHLILINIGSYPFDALMNEIEVWSTSGAKGDVKFSINVKIKIAVYHAITALLINWPLIAALYFGARGPRSPRGKNLLTRLSKHAVETDNASLRKQMAS